MLTIDKEKQCEIFDILQYLHVYLCKEVQILVDFRDIKKQEAFQMSLIILSAYCTVCLKLCLTLLLLSTINLIIHISNFIRLIIANI